MKRTSSSNLPVGGFCSSSQNLSNCKTEAGWEEIYGGSALSLKPSYTKTGCAESTSVISSDESLMLGSRCPVPTAELCVEVGSSRV